MAAQPYDRTPFGLAQRIFTDRPELSDNDLMYILWEFTAFPLCNYETLEQQLQAFHDYPAEVEAEIQAEHDHGVFHSEQETTKDNDQDW